MPGARPQARLLADAPGYVVFTVWVSVCTFAPEAIWQGLVLLRGHFGAAELYTALFIGTLFTFFVEPLMERLRVGRWRLVHGPTGNLLLRSLLALAFGFLVVCLHESMTTYLGGAHSGEEAKRAALAHALREVQEWASLPAAMMVAWFVGALWRRWAYLALGIACLWSVAAGVLYAWEWQVVVGTAVPCCLIGLLGTRAVRRNWSLRTVPVLAKLVALVAVCWLPLEWLIGAAFIQAGHQPWDVYAPNQIAEDFRFYLGWFLGLSVAPNPVSDRAGASGVHAGS